MGSRIRSERNAVRLLRETGTATITQTMSVEEARRRYPDAAALGRFRHDCDFPGCQLSLGHPSLHCIVGRRTSPDGPPDSYLMCDNNGNVVRKV